MSSLSTIQQYNYGDAVLTIIGTIVTVKLTGSFMYEIHRIVNFSRVGQITLVNNFYVNNFYVVRFKRHLIAVLHCKHACLYFACMGSTQNTNWLSPYITAAHSNQQEMWKYVTYTWPVHRYMYDKDTTEHTACSMKDKNNMLNKEHGSLPCSPVCKGSCESPTKSGTTSTIHYCVRTKVIYHGSPSCSKLGLHVYGIEQSALHHKHAKHLHSICTQTSVNTQCLLS